MVMREGQTGRAEYTHMFEASAFGHVGQWPSLKSSDKKNAFYHHEAPSGVQMHTALCY